MRTVTKCQSASLFHLALSPPSTQEAPELCPPQQEPRPGQGRGRGRGRGGPPGVFDSGRPGWRNGFPNLVLQGALSVGFCSTLLSSSPRETGASVIIAPLETWETKSHRNWGSHRRIGRGLDSQAFWV